MPPRPVVTLAALHGTGGHLVGPRVADRLGVPFLDRAIPAGAAREAGVPERAIDDVDEHQRSGLQRLVANLARVSPPTAGTGAVERVDIDERAMRSEIEEFLARSARHGGVILGRGGAVVLRSVPGALHVYLGGPRDGRVHRTMREAGLDRKAADRRVHSYDRSRLDYVRNAYGVDGHDPDLYHLMIDAVAFDVEGCVDLIVSACDLRMRFAQRTG